MVVGDERAGDVPKRVVVGVVGRQHGVDIVTLPRERLRPLPDVPLGDDIVAQRRIEDAPLVAGRPGEHGDRRHGTRASDHQGMFDDDVAVEAGMERALRRHESGVDTALRGKDLLDARFAGAADGARELLGDG